MNYWKNEEIVKILPHVNDDIDGEVIKKVALQIGRSEQATRRKILEIIGVVKQSSVVRIALASHWEPTSSLECPKLDKSFIPNEIFSEILSNRKIKLKRGMKVCLRPKEEVFRLDQFNSPCEPWCGKTVTIGAFYGKSFWLKEDESEYPVQFHVDLIKKFDNEK
jgi:hypothetical protein